MTTITKIALGSNGPLVSKLGLGCMRMSSIWGSKAQDEGESIATIQAALDSGINFLNTGDFYGSGHNELLVGKALKGRRDDAFVSVKFGAIFHGGQWLGLDLRPIAIKNFINYSLVRLGIETIDRDLQSVCSRGGTVLNAVGAEIGNDRHAAGDHKCAAVRQSFAIRNHIDGTRSGISGR